MNKQTPTQIATQSMKGCGCSFVLDDYPNSAPIEDFKCGNILSTKIEFCYMCQSKILAHKQDWENELEFLKDLNGNEFNKNVPMCMGRYKELTSALKILEAEK